MDVEKNSSQYHIIKKFTTEFVNQLISIITNELTKISIRLKANKLSLILSKTNFTFFHPRQKELNVYVLLVLENIVIKHVTETKFLGVLIDHRLSRKPHSLVSKKISMCTGIIAKTAFIFLLKRCCPCIFPSYILIEFIAVLPGPPPTALI